MTIMDFTIRVLTAILFGLLIGLERQLTGHMAGVRINVLVCLGTSLFVMFSQLMGVADTTRIAAQIVSGVGFLCSGIIFKDGVQVRGLNTAATIWCTAAIGVLTSSGKYEFAGIAALLLLLANILLRPLANRVIPLRYFDESENFYRLSVTCKENDEMKARSMIIQYLSGTRMMLTNLESADAIGNRVEIEATMKCSGSRKEFMALEQMVEKVSLQDGVSAVGWEMI